MMRFLVVCCGAFLIIAGLVSVGSGVLRDGGFGDGTGAADMLQGALLIGAGAVVIAFGPVLRALDPVTRARSRAEKGDAAARDQDRE